MLNWLLRVGAPDESDVIEYYRAGSLLSATSTDSTLSSFLTSIALGAVYALEHAAVGEIPLKKLWSSINEFVKSIGPSYKSCIGSSNVFFPNDSSCDLK